MNKTEKEEDRHPILSIVVFRHRWQAAGRIGRGLLGALFLAVLSGLLVKWITG